MKPGIVNNEIDKSAFYDKGIVISNVRDATRHLADVFSEVYITSPSKVEPLEELDLTAFALTATLC
jgi:hypothetical protein